MTTSSVTTSAVGPNAVRRPHRDAATHRNQILQATIVLIDRHGPDTISMRQIAAEADVNHAVIYRHFGNRAALISEAILSEMNGWAVVVEAASDPISAFTAGFNHLAQRAHVAGALARAMTGMPATTQSRYPVVDAYIGQLTAAGLGESEASEVATAAVALMTGWIAAEPFWIAAGHPRGVNVRDQARAGLLRQLVTMVEANLP